MSDLNFPTSEEKQRVVLMALQNGQRLTTQVCCWLYHTTELRKIVCRLIEDGHDIRREKVPGENFKEYFIPQTVN